MSTRSPKLVMSLAWILLAMTSHAEVLHDPTRPATPAPAASAAARSVAVALRLEAIVRSDGRRVAIVNGKVVRVGDRIADAVIVDISDREVAYTRAGARHVAQLPKHAVNVRPSALNTTDPS